VVDDRVRHIQTSIARKPEPKTQIYVLRVAKVTVVEASYLQKSIPSIKRGRGARGKDLLWLKISAICPLSVTSPPVDAGYVVHIGCTV
jgi:hypothetical protein